MLRQDAHRPGCFGDDAGPEGAEPRPCARPTVVTGLYRDGVGDEFIADSCDHHRTGLYSVRPLSQRHPIALDSAARQAVQRGQWPWGSRFIPLPLPKQQSARAARRAQAGQVTPTTVGNTAVASIHQLRR